jgi:hypothetical protein
MVAKFEDLDAMPAPCFVDYEEVQVRPENKSARRRSQVEQVDLSLFNYAEAPEQHATDKMVYAREVLLATSEENSQTINNLDTASENSNSDFDDDEETSCPLADFKPSLIKSSLSL